MDISKFLVKIFGDKKSRDLKAYKPMVEEVLKVYEVLKKNQYGQYLKDVLDGKFLDVIQ